LSFRCLGLGACVEHDADVTLRFEADDEAALVAIKALFKQFLLAQNPQLAVDFH